MDSQLASVLTSGSLNVQNGSRCAERSGPVTEGFLDPKEETSLGTVPGNLQSVPVKAAVPGQDAPSINGKKPEVGGTSGPASQETSKIGGFRQPITVKTGVPMLRGQPIRLKIVVPPRCKRPITDSAISLTKEFALPHLRRRPVSLSPGAMITGKKRSQILKVSAVKKKIKEVTYQRTEEAKPESFHGPEAERGVEGDVSGVKIIHSDESPLISSTNTFQTLSLRAIKEETTKRDTEQIIPLVLQETDLRSCETFDEEQTEPLDLSLPRKREKRCERLLDDSGCESSLIMEVDEYEGDGDRDIVEEDDVGPAEGSVMHVDAANTPEDSLLPPSFFSTSVFSSLPSIDCDTEDLLLIDDQGIPYTLSLDGLKVPQVGASASAGPCANPTEAEGSGPLPLALLADPDLSQSLDKALSAPSYDPHTSMSHLNDPPSLSFDQTKAKKEIPKPCKAIEPSVRPVQEANVNLSPSSGISVPTQPIQILTNSSTNAPFLLLSTQSSPQLCQAPLGLTLPLAVTQTSPGASSAPLFLLLSSVPSLSSGDPAYTPTSTPIAVLDPSTGQLSQITSVPSASLPLALTSSGGQVGALSHPVITLSPNNLPVIRPGVNNVTSGSTLASHMVRSPSPTLQSERSSTAPIVQSQISLPGSNPGSEAISAEEVSNENNNNKPSPFPASSPHPQSSDPPAQPDSEAQSPASEHTFVDPSDLHLQQHLPLDDHLYFSNAAAPPSPTVGPVLSPGELDLLDPLDPLSPGGSPDNMAARRVLYCHLCPRVFFYLSDLERHAITHSQKKPHVCQQCGKAFKRSSHLQRHKHIHTGQRNFVCPICAKRFREAGELQRHQRVHTGEKPYQCQLCHTRFAERNTLRRHTKRKHPYHQVAMEMLSERRGSGGQGSGGGVGGGVGGAGAQEEEESAEWYSSTVSHLDNSESDPET